VLLHACMYCLIWCTRCVSCCVLVLVVCVFVDGWANPPRTQLCMFWEPGVLGNFYPEQSLETARGEASPPQALYLQMLLIRLGQLFDACPIPGPLPPKPPRMTMCSQLPTPNTAASYKFRPTDSELQFRSISEIVRAFPAQPEFKISDISLGTPIKHELHVLNYKYRPCPRNSKQAPKTRS
jgi:hypothetical protein